MKVTEAWKNRDSFIEECKEKKLYTEELNKLLDAKDEESFLRVVYVNFSWCVNGGILEEWLPDIVYTKRLNCNACYKLKSLPELPNCEWLYCSRCETLELLPDLPNCRGLDCRFCDSLESLPDLPKCRELDCSYCDKLTSFPKLPECKRLSFVGCDNLRVGE